MMDKDIYVKEYFYILKNEKEKLYVKKRRADHIHYDFLSLELSGGLESWWKL